MSTSKLWNKNFTIITVGTVISMLGNAISGFAIGLLVLDYTQSIFLYSLFMVAYNLPKIIMPMVAGPYLDNFPRAKVIYTLDFLSAALYLGLFFLLHFNIFSFWPFLALAVLIGSIDSVYQTAYDSLYPKLIGKEHYSKAYSISSIIYPLAAVMVPVAAFAYQKLGNIAPLFLFNAATFLIAAIMEVFIKAPETHVQHRTQKFTAKYYFNEFKAGVDYIRSEKGLLVITAYFLIANLSYSTGALALPYFKTTPGLDVMAYTFVMGANLMGRLVGGFLHYKMKLPPKRKFAIALTVYITTCVLEGGYLFTPVGVMIALMFLSGLLSVTSFNIRISATQSYIPNDYRGRFNGSFQMLLSFGMIVGQLVSGALGDYFSARAIIMIGYMTNLAAVFLVMLPGGKHVKRIYNAVYETPEKPEGLQEPNLTNPAAQDE
ncbi:MAG TPA: MFS transporter [Oscillospiraceae bacterium]|nr:MFS transporter [Oscillospiraceae bacterium]HPF55438.1 MFS transporter [Clostridiales bacterium]HPK36247.1 MFS transporter [Oscillospiraceae bacterium]HPR75485.1 MFS transporter [Oscillospiraceae bacterium]